MASVDEPELTHLRAGRRAMAETNGNNGYSLPAGSGK